MPKPNLQDVAEYACVSTATVSRCINSPEKVKKKLRDKVLSAIATLGYTPHGAARALASRRSYTIGAVVPTIGGDIFSNALHSLQKGITKQGFTLLLASNNYSLEEEFREVKSLVSKGLDGLVLIGNLHSPQLYELLANEKIPFVNLWTWQLKSQHSCIGFNNYTSAKVMASHLFGLGHRKVAVISGNLLDNDRATQRLQGIQDYFSEQGYAIANHLIVECRYSAQESRDAVLELLVKEPQISAVICGNDILAIGALSAARRLKIAVPSALSISGFDNLEITAELYPGLSTIDVPAKEMGSLAATYLLDCIQKESFEVKRVELVTELIIRQTTSVPGREPTLIS